MFIDARVLRWRQLFSAAILAAAASLPASAFAALTVTPLTWNVIGLDSNSPTSGPKNFPVGARVCSNTATSNVNVNIIFDSPNANINLRAGSLSALNFASIGAGACVDAYFEVEVTQVAAAYDTTRRYHITATDGTGSYSTPTPRELYVEHLISQNRNSVTNIRYGTAPANLVSVAAGGALNLVVGNTYIIELTGGTATQGYGQFEEFINFSNAIFEILAVNTTYAADNSPYVPNPNDKLYADACLWEPNPYSPNYNSCVGGDYKAGGAPVVTTYTLKIVGGGGTSQTLNTLLYDFSGSSFHYNSDFSAGTRIANIIDPTSANISKAFAPNPAQVNGVSVLTFTLTNPNAGALSGYNFVDNLPAGLVIATPAGATTSGCGVPTLTANPGGNAITFSNGTVAGNGSCTIGVNVTPTAVGSFVNTTNDLFIDNVDTGHSATATLTANNAPAPPACTPGIVVARWTMDPAQGAAVPPLPSSVSSLLSTAIASTNTTGTSAIDATNTGNPSNSWGVTGGWASTNTGYPNGGAAPYFQFQLDTSKFSNVSVIYDYHVFGNWAASANNHLYTYSSANGGAFTNLSDISNFSKADTWKTTLTLAAAATGTSTTTFRINAVGQQQPTAELALDNIIFTGCAVPDYPTLAKTFAPNPIRVSGASTLTFTLTNPNNIALTGAAFTDALPAGTQVASPASPATTCGGTWAPTSGATSLTFSGGTIPASGSCTVSVSIAATTAGPHSNVSGFLSTTQTGTNATSVASATLTAIAPPQIAKQFDPSPVLASGIARLTFTIENPNPNDTISGVAFSDTLPAAPGAMVVAATPNTSISGCGAPTFAPSAGASTLSFSNGTIPGGGTCTVGVDVTAAAVGTYNNLSGAVSFVINGVSVSGNTASANLVVDPPHPGIGLLKQIAPTATGAWLSFLAVNPPANVYYQLTVENTGDVPLSSVTITDPQVDTAACAPPATLPVAVAANNDHIYTCVVGPVAALTGNHTNTATASGTYSGNTINDTDSAAYATAAMSLVKSATESSYTLPGDVLHYSYLVTNTGAATLSGPITVTDDHTTVTCPALNTIGNNDDFFQSGEVLTCTATYTITTTDVSNASVTNTAFATNGSSVSNTDSVTVPLSTSADVSITKTLTTAGPYSVGGTVSYTLHVANAGPSTATSIQVTDTPTNLTITNVSGGGCAAMPCTIASLAMGGSVDISVTATIDAAGSFDNAATVSAAQPDPDTSNNTDHSGNTTGASADVSMDKSLVTPGPYLAGQALAYTLVVANAGPSDATNVQVTDTPTNLTITNVSGGGCAALPCTIASLAAGNSVTITVTATIDAAGAFDNSATATADEFDPNLGNNTDNTGNGGNASPSADLGITKTDGVASVTAGGTTTYTIVASNAGPSPVAGAALIDTLPGAVTSATWACVGAGGGTCPAGGSGNVNASVDLPVGASVTFTVSANISPGASGTLGNTAIVVAPGGVNDPNPANNSATDTDTLTSQADLAITKTDGSATYTPGGTTTYTIVASNAGPSNATGATVSDTLPAGLTATWTCVGAGGGTCTASGSGNINDPVDLPAGGSVTYTVSATISASASGTLSNTATVAAPAGVTDPNPGNNSATDTDTLAAQADLSITKTDGSATYTPGGTTTYTITASNAGPSSAAGATVADTLPGVLTATWTCVGAGGGTCTASGSGSINDTVNLPVGGSVTYTVSATISASATGSLSNTATVAAPAGVTDPNPGNNSATDTDTQAANITLSKIAPANAKANGALTYTIGLGNSGSASSTTSVTVADALPAGVVATSVTPGTGVSVVNCGTLPSAAGATLTCAVTLSAPIPAGSANGAATFAIAATAPGTAGSITNFASVDPNGGSSPPPPGAGCTPVTSCGSATTTVVAPPTIAKAFNPTSILVNGTTQLGLAIANPNASQSLSGVGFTDTFPSGMTVASPVTTTNSCGGTLTAVGNANSIALSGGTIAAGGNCAITVVVTDNTVGTANNTTGAVTSNEGGTGTPSNTAALTVAVPSLSVTKTANGPWTIGQSSPQPVYTIAVSNSAAATAASSGAITITDNLPLGITLASAAGTNWSCSGTTALSCIFSGTIAIGASTTLTLNVAVGATASNGNNTATMTGGGDPTCPGGANCTSTVGVAVTSPSLGVIKTSNGPWIVNQAGADYTLTVTNTGTAPTSGAITLGDLLPNGISAPASFTSGTWMCATAGQNLTCTSSAVLAATNGSSQITVPVTVGAAAVGTATNNASVGGGGDPNNGGTPPVPGSCMAGDPHCGSTSTAVTSPNLTIQKTGPANALAGGDIVYTITVSNTGAAASTNTILDDPAPASLSFVSAGAPCASGFPCDLGSLTPGQSVTIAAVTFHVASTANGTLTNTASVTSDQTTQISSSASTVLAQPAPVEPTPIDTRWMLLAMLGLLLAAGAWRLHAPR